MVQQAPAVTPVVLASGAFSIMARSLACLKAADHILHGKQLCEFLIHLNLFLIN